MDTTAWSFLIVVVICSISGYFILKKYSLYYAKKKTDKLIHNFMKDNDIEMTNKSLEEIERELMEEDEKYELIDKKKKKKKKKDKKDKKDKNNHTSQKKKG